MNFRRRKCLRKYFGFVILLLNINCIFCSLNTSKFSRNESEYDKYDLKTLSVRISDKLKQATYVELGVTSMQKIYDSLKFTSNLRDEDKDVEQIAIKLEDKITRAFDILNSIKTDIVNYSTTNMRLSLSSQTYIIPGEQLHKDTDENDVKHNKSIIIINFGDKYLSRIFSDHLFNITRLGLKQAYFLSSSDLMSKIDLSHSYGDYDDTYIWNLYTSLTRSKQRNIIIALDLGSTFSNKIFNIVKTVAKQVIRMSDSNDQIGVISFGYDWNSPYITGYNCQTSSQTSPLTTDECKLSRATSHNKIIFHRFIESLTRVNGSTNHQVVFKQLFKSVRLNFEPGSKDPVMLLYITPSAFVSYNETSNILLQIAEDLNEDLSDVPVVINTIFIRNQESITYQEHFLRDLSELNFNKFNIKFTKTENQISGIMQSVNSTTGLGLVTAKIFNSLQTKKIVDIEPGISLPTWQESTRDLIISVYIPCGNSVEFGLLGLDIHYSSIAEDITYYSNQIQYTYAFLLNMDGSVIMHPSFSRPIVTSEQPKFVDISYFEKYDNFTLVRDAVLNKEKGSQQIVHNNETLKYIWQRVLHWYIVCVVIKGDSLSKINKKVILPDTSTHYNLLHHRLDLLPPPTLCRHLNQISTLDTGVVYLSASCFQSPYSYLRDIAGLSVSSLTLQSYMAYIKDNTRLLANPGLRNGVKSDVTILSYMLKYLIKQHLQGSLYKYSIRRYVATVNGVMLMYPGSILDVELEPVKRNWFVRAMEHPGKIVLTSPYLDAGGAGYIVTISHTIFEKNTSDNVVAVMAMDVTFGYIYKILLETVPYCSKQETVKCFIIDDKGYLIYHPNLIDLHGKGPIEQQHIIHKESLVANDLLNHKGFVKKILCNNYADDTVQRYYKFNTSMNTVLSNLVHGEHCVKYFISAIPNTNAFIGVVNFTCTDVATFCPCSTVNRLCLICNRVEQNECECPCECPLNLDNDTCPQANKNLNDNQLCSPLTETSPFTSNSMYYSIAAGLKPCLPFLCEIHTTYESCVGLIGCEWCHLDVDGETKLQNPFCTSLTMCFHGILGSVSPYRDVHLEAISSDDLFVSTYSSVGPAAGSIVALCFILALVFYCYRQYSLQFMERLYPNSTPSRMQRVQMSSINADHFNDEGASHQDKLLANFPKDIGPISPYCITTEYRKPTTGVDSDLGYSTMTPHEESERLSFALIELDSFEDDCNTSDAVSTNTSVLAYKSPKLLPKEKTFSECDSSSGHSPGTTVLPNKHCILASVTVHRNMETI